MRLPFAIAAATVATAALAGCAQEKQIYVSDAWVRLPAAAGRPGAGYFTLHGGPTDATLVSVSSEVAIRTEMHETRKGPDGAMTMAPIASVPLPALKTVSFAPGGRHLMFFDINPAVKAGGGMLLTFTFADATRIQYSAEVIGAGDPAPK